MIQFDVVPPSTWCLSVAVPSVLCLPAQTPISSVTSQTWPHVPPPAPPGPPWGPYIWALTDSDGRTSRNAHPERIPLISLFSLLSPLPCPPSISFLFRMNRSSACRRSLIFYREHMHTTSISQLSTMKLMRQSGIWRTPLSLCAQPHSGSQSPGSIRPLPRYLMPNWESHHTWKSLFVIGLVSAGRGP